MIPISTDTPVRRTPVANYALVAANVLVFFLLGGFVKPTALGQEWLPLLALNGDNTHLFQFLTHQFLHADYAHIGGNMLFLWVFGNAVNAKMGHIPYVLFYLAGGVFAATGHAYLNPDFTIMVGASGAIAAVTTAYLALFPRSHVTILYWWFIIGTFEIPSLLLIVFKMILWDNILAKYMVAGGAVQAVAFDAHLSGYAFGLAASTAMLALRVLPRDQFDIVALWKRWLQRQGLRSAMSDPSAQARARFGRVARPVSVKDVSGPAMRSPQHDRITELRGLITQALGRNDRDEAARLYEKLLDNDPRQVLARSQQLDVANQLYTLNRVPQATAAYEKFLANYPGAPEMNDVKLLLGIIYARDLKQYEVAEAHLRQLLEQITDERRRAQCQHWLDVATQGLNRPDPGT